MFGEVHQMSKAFEPIMIQRSWEAWLRTSRKTQRQRRNWFQDKVHRFLQSWRWSPARSSLEISQTLHISKILQNSWQQQKYTCTFFRKRSWKENMINYYRKQLSLQSKDSPRQCLFHKRCKLEYPKKNNVIVLESPF